MKYFLPATADNAEGNLDSGIASDALLIPLGSGEGAKFPTIINADTTSAGTSTTLNATGIAAVLSAAGIGVGAMVENLDDESHAFILSISTDSITTTELQGGSGNDWGDGDNYAINRFIVTLNARNSSGVITSSEKVLIDSRSGDNLTVNASGRGYDGSTPATWSADDYCNLFVISKMHEEVQKAFAEIGERIDSTYSQTEVDALLRARNWKEDVVCATTAAGTLASSFEDGDTIDGVTLATGDRILIQDQADASENGIYVVNASGAPTRATDFDATAEITAAVVVPKSGTSNADTLFVCTSNDPVVDTDDIEFSGIVSLTKADDTDAATGADDTKYVTVAKVVHLLGNLASAVATKFTYTRTAKTTPVDADAVMLMDSEDSNEDKKVTIANLLATKYLIASDDLLASSDDVDTTTSGTYELLKQFRVFCSGTIRVKFSSKSGSGGETAYGKIYKNGVAIGTERANATTSYVEYSEDIAISDGDYIEIYGKTTSGVTGSYCNFRLYCAKATGGALEIAV